MNTPTRPDDLAEGFAEAVRRRDDFRQSEPERFAEFVAQRMYPLARSQLPASSLLMRFVRIGQVEAVGERAFKEWRGNPVPERFAGGLSAYARLAYEALLCMGSGCDHCMLFRPVLFGLSGGDVAWAAEMFGPHLGRSAQGHASLVAATNLLVGLLHDDAGLLSAATVEARTFCLRKSTNKYDSALVGCLLAIAERNTELVSTQLELICTLHAKNKAEVQYRDPVFKTFSAAAHALEHLARRRGLTPSPPKHAVFWPVYASYLETATQPPPCWLELCALAPELEPVLRP